MTITAKIKDPLSEMVPPFARSVNNVAGVRPLQAAVPAKGEESINVVQQNAISENTDNNSRTIENIHKRLLELEKKVKSLFDNKPASTKLTQRQSIVTRFSRILPLSFPTVVLKEIINNQQKGQRVTYGLQGNQEITRVFNIIRTLFEMAKDENNEEQQGGGVSFRLGGRGRGGRRGGGGRPAPGRRTGTARTRGAEMPRPTPNAGGLGNGTQTRPNSPQTRATILNRGLEGLGRVGRVAGRVVPFLAPVMGVMSGLDARADELQETGNETRANIVGATTGTLSLAGGLAGATAGVSAGTGVGAAIGTAIAPGVGTAVGAGIGAGIGAITGGIAGSGIGDAVGRHVGRLISNVVGQQASPNPPAVNQARLTHNVIPVVEQEIRQEKTIVEQSKRQRETAAVDRLEAARNNNTIKMTENSNQAYYNPNNFRDQSLFSYTPFVFTSVMRSGHDHHDGILYPM